MSFATLGRISSFPDAVPAPHTSLRPGVASRGPSRSFFARLVDALAESNRRRAEREIARVLERRRGSVRHSTS